MVYQSKNIRIFSCKAGSGILIASFLILLLWLLFALQGHAQEDLQLKTITDRGGEEYYLISRNALANSRPPDFYDLSLSTHEAVCESFLEGLNSPYTVQDHTINNIDFESEVLLFTDFTDQFRPVPAEVIGFGPSHSPRIEFAPVDIDNNGNQETVFRQTYTRGGVVFHMLYFIPNTLVTNIAENDQVHISELTVGGGLNLIGYETEYSSLREDVIEIVIHDAPQFDEPYLGSLGFTTLYYYLAEVDGEIFFLFTNANFPNAPINTFVTKLEVSVDPELVCHFRSNYIVIPHALFQSL